MSDYNDSLPCMLRPGHIAGMYYRDILDKPAPNQLTVLHELYPGLLIEVIPTDGNTKIEPVFDDASGLIRAAVYHGKLYAGGSSRVSQITARLIGTARSGIEKERRTAADMQIRIAKELSENPDLLISLWNHYSSLLENWTDDTASRAVESVFLFVENLPDSLLSDSANDELFPMDPEVTAELMMRVLNRLNTDSEEGFLDAWLWLLLGALLRNEIRRLLYRYRADFSLTSEPAISSSDDSGKELDYVYEGDDMEKRFPGIEWYCDRCNARLDTQEGFHDFVHVWKCTNCGYKNRIEIDEIYDSEEDYQEGNSPVDPPEFFRALKIRTDELDDET